MTEKQYEMMVKGIAWRSLVGYTTGIIPIVWGLNEILCEKHTRRHGAVIIAITVTFVGGL